MKPLFKNDLRWAGPLGLLGLIIYMLSLTSHSPGTVWAVPDVFSAATGLIFTAIAGAVLGLVAGLVEDVTRTREYLLHRPVSVGRIFWTRHALGLAVVAAWIVVVPPLHLLGAYLFSPNAALFDDGRLAMMIGLALPGFLFYALGVWVAAVPRTILGGTLLLAGTGIPLLLAVLAGVVLTPTAISVAMVLACLALTPLLLLAALSAVRAGRDPDRPWTAARMRVGGPVAALVAILAGTMAATLLQTGATAGLLDLYPKVGEQDGRAVMFRWSSWDREFRQTDDQHRMGAVIEHPPSPTLFDPSDDAWSMEDSGDVHIRRFPGRGRYYRGQVYGRAYTQYTGRQVFLGSDGYVHLYSLAERDGRGEDRPRVFRLGKGPQNLPFSAETKRANYLWDRVGALHDPVDGGLWLYDFQSGATSFHRVELPDGDHFVAQDWLKVYPSKSWGRPQSLSPVFLWGQRGRYALNEQGSFERAAADDNAIPAPQTKDQVSIHSPTHFTAAVVSPEGRTLFTHDYSPRTLAERASAALIYGASLMRPAATSLLSLSTGERQAFDFQRLLLDPAVARAGHWLVPANLLVALLLAGWTWRRLGRLGVTGGRRRFWVGAVLVGGVPVFLCQRLVESRRAWQPLPPADKAVAPVLMIPNLPAVRPA